MIQPRHLDDGETTDGFSIGGMLASKYKMNYSLKEDSFKSVFAGSPYKTTGKISTAPSKISINPLKNSSTINSDMKLSSASDATRSPTAQSMPSFILNEDMMKLRQAETVILKEEEKLGMYSLDPNGRLVPALQVVCDI